MRCPGNPNPVETEESDPSARPAFGLGVDSPGATRICSLLVRGTLTFRSFRRLPSQAETGRTCDDFGLQWSSTILLLDAFAKTRRRLARGPRRRAWTRV